MGQSQLTKIVLLWYNYGKMRLLLPRGVCSDRKSSNRMDYVRILCGKLKYERRIDCPMNRNNIMRRI